MGTTAARMPLGVKDYTPASMRQGKGVQLPACCGVQSHQPEGHPAPLLAQEAAADRMQRDAGAGPTPPRLPATQHAWGRSSWDRGASWWRAVATDSAGRGRGDSCEPQGGRDTLAPRLSQQQQQRDKPRLCWSPAPPLTYSERDGTLEMAPCCSSGVAVPKERPLAACCPPWQALPCTERHWEVPGCHEKGTAIQQCKMEMVYFYAGKVGSPQNQGFSGTNSLQSINRLTQSHGAPLSLPGLWKRQCHRLHGVPAEPGQDVGAQGPAVPSFLPSYCTARSQAPCCMHYGNPGLWRGVFGGVPISPQLHPAFLTRRCQTKAREPEQSYPTEKLPPPP